ncbi:MAG: GTPase ObgE, partial [Muribaculaceae bacterium]|nr:GTPase ObgE [Muribaculaceae bacterium]
ITKELPQGIQTVFISAVTGQGLTELKDLLWREINSEENKVKSTMTHRDLDVRTREPEEEEFIFYQEDEDEVPLDEINWDEEFWDEEDKVNG